MKKLIFYSAVAITLLFSACSEGVHPDGNAATKQKGNSGMALDTTKLKSGDLYYQCEMDQDVISDKPGTCSKCGMDLIKKEKK